MAADAIGSTYEVGWAGWPGMSRKSTRTRPRSDWQEIYDVQGTLIQVHEKYPVDKGHQPT